MQPNGEHPPSYFDIAPNAPSAAVMFSGDYKGVPVYQMGSNNAPIPGQTVFQQAPLITNGTHMAQINTISVGSKPVHCVCPKCHQQIVTCIEHDAGTFAWLICVLLTVVGCIPCCLIPFCASAFQDAVHKCPQCSTIIGTYKIM